MQLLLISNSTNPGEAYLDYPKRAIEAFLKKSGVERVLFVPYAAVTFSYDTYVQKVQDRFNDFNIAVEGVHTKADPILAVNEAQAIVVGGGNTFHLLKYVQKLGLLDAIRKRVMAGVPYIGWSAGANLACPTICTTNDMPIVQPISFDALNLITFQINPHYLDTHPAGHGGETREQRIEEYLVANTNRYVVGLRESCMLLYDNSSIQLIGPKSMRVFKHSKAAIELEAGADLNFLLK